jgi:adenosine kinase
VRIAVSGSIANDYLMSFPGKIREHIVAEQLERVSLSFLIDSLQIRRGGVAANISFGMAQLGLTPLLVGAVGRDFFSEYGPHLTDTGVDTSALHVAEHAHTSLFLCTTDQEENQIASFYPGAMDEAPDIDLEAIGAAHGQPDLVVVCPNAPSAMTRHTRQARDNGWAVAADPSQQLPRLDGETIAELVDGAAYLLSNDYEAALIESKTGWSSNEILRRVGVRVTTHGPKGCVIERSGEEPVEVPAVPPVDGDGPFDPTGVGDAFRAGFLSGMAQGLSLERAAQIGSLVATESLEADGPQEYWLRSPDAGDRFAATYGDEAAGEVAGLLGRA